MTDRLHRLALLLLPFALGACALTTKQDPVVPRYYSPFPEAAGVPTDSQDAQRGAGLALRLQRVSAADTLSEALVSRVGPHEYDLAEDRLWTEPPAAYLERALAQRLFEREGVTRAVSGFDAPVLDVQLTAFEELRAQGAARVEVVLVLARDRDALLEVTLSADRPVDRGADDDARPSGDAVARALGLALSDVLDQATARIVAALRAAAPPG